VKQRQRPGIENQEQGQDIFGLKTIVRPDSALTTVYRPWKFTATCFTYLPRKSVDKNK